MTGARRKIRAGLLVSVCAVATMVYVLLYQQNHVTRSNNPIIRWFNETGSSTKRPMELEIRNISKHIEFLERENSQLLDVLVNMSRQNGHLLQQLDRNVESTDTSVRHIENSSLNTRLTVVEYQDSVDTIREVLNRKEVILAEHTATNKKPTSLLTLFTTWADDPTKYPIYNITVKNWASFKPVINPVVFSNDASVLKEVNRFGWKGLNIPKVADNGMPILKYMYMEAAKTYDSVFYAYANADIVFTGSLLQTLTSLQYSDTFKRSKHVFVSGVRTNLVVNFTADYVSKRDELQKISTARGSHFLTSAEDYFIMDRTYPWHEFPEVVVGIIAYDNWLVADARNRSYTVIDATRTLKAVHLSETGDHFVSHVKDRALYNKELLQKAIGDKLNYFKGFTDCMELFTDLHKDAIVIQNRTEFAYYC